MNATPKKITTLKNPAKYVLTVATTLIALFLITLYLIGLSLSGEVNNKRKCLYNQSQDKIWELLSDIKSSPRWRHPVFTRVEKLPDSAGHGIFREHYQGGESTDIEIVEMTKPSKIVRKFIHGDFSGSWTIEIKKQDERCEVWITEKGQIDSPYMRVFSKALIGATYIENYLRNISRFFKETPTVEEFK